MQSRVGSLSCTDQIVYQIGTDPPRTEIVRIIQINQIAANVHRGKRLEKNACGDFKVDMPLLGLAGCHSRSSTTMASAKIEY